MKSIFSFQVDWMKTLNKQYPHIKIYDKSQLLKIITSDQLPFVLKNMGKKVDKVILPNEVFRFYFQELYCYTQDFIRGAFSLLSFSRFEKDFSDREILIFYRNLLETCFQMHQQDIMSGDLWYKNILLMEDLDYRFIDLELRSSPLFLSHQEELYQDYPFSFQLMISDNTNLLAMILYSMLFGVFLDSRILSPIIDMSPFEFPNSIEERLKNAMLGVRIMDQNYFLEEFDTLIQKGYKLPYRRK